MLHDFFRTKVTPAAANMLSMVRTSLIFAIPMCFGDRIKSITISSQFDLRGSMISQSFTFAVSISFRFRLDDKFIHFQRFT